MWTLELQLWIDAKMEFIILYVCYIKKVKAFNKKVSLLVGNWCFSLFYFIKYDSHSCISHEMSKNNMSKGILVWKSVMYRTHFHNLIRVCSYFLVQPKLLIVLCLKPFNSSIRFVFDHETHLHPIILFFCLKGHRTSSHLQPTIPVTVGPSQSMCFTRANWNRFSKISFGSPNASLSLFLPRRGIFLNAEIPCLLFSQNTFTLIVKNPRQK